MRLANDIEGIMDAFNPNELSIDELKDFYYDGTMGVRTGDDEMSPMDNIYEDCHKIRENNTFLLIGHKGTGKSTELNHLAKRLMDEGHPLRVIACAKDVDPESEMYIEILILMAEAVISMAEEKGVELEEDIKKLLVSFWLASETQTTNTNNQSAISAGLGVEAETPTFLKKLLKVVGSVKADIKYSEETQNEYRLKIERRPSEWLYSIKSVAGAIADSCGKQPIVIFEDLDKLDNYDPNHAWSVFLTRSGFLKDFNFPVIYTFPIALSYDHKFGSIDALYGRVERLPMIQVNDRSGQPYDHGVEVMKSIIKKRAKLELFEENALEKAIQMTGGSLRDLFRVIRDASRLPARRKESIILTRDIEKQLKQIKMDRRSRINQTDYPFLMEIYNGKKDLITDSEELLKMIRADVVLEYNGERWYDLHPLIREYFTEHLEEIKELIQNNDRSKQ